jgi:fumarylacetoacetase
MPLELDETHDPTRRSWVASAADGSGDFPIQNLPLGVFRRRGTPERARIGTAIGDQVLDLQRCVLDRLLEALPPETTTALCGESLNEFMRLPRDHWSDARRAISGLLEENCSSKPTDQLVPMADVEMSLPATIGDYTDFYASIHHATNVGSMFRPDNPLLPNYKHMPVGYHGRASSIVVSGTEVRRPMGQTAASDAGPPTFGPSRLLDYEMELGVFVGPGNELGTRIPMSAARDHLFGMVIVNDWSARDIQKWEYQPLGPFNAKNFATTISPWVVTLAALEPYRVAGPPRGPGDPAPLEYLRSSEFRVPSSESPPPPGSKSRRGDRGTRGEGASDGGTAADGAVDITVEVRLASQRMRERGTEPMLVSKGSFREMYWTIAQMLVHHTVAGCNLRPGDLLASGTISGPDEDSRGCLLERTWRGTQPLKLPDAAERRFLEDGDEVIMRAYCERPGFARIGFGECRGVILAAR